MPFCPSCGAEIPGGEKAAFCMSCGKPLPKLTQSTLGQQALPAQQQDLLNMIERAAADTQPAGVQPLYLFGGEANAPKAPVVQATTVKSGMQLFAEEPAAAAPAPSAPAQQQQVEPQVYQSAAPVQQPALQQNAQQSAAGGNSAPLSVSQIQKSIFANSANDTPNTTPPANATQIYRAVPAQEMPTPPVNAQQEQQSIKQIYAAQQSTPRQQPVQAPVNRAPVAPPPPPRTPLPAYSAEPQHEPKRSKGRTALKVVSFTLIFAILLAGATLALLWYQNRPEKTIDTFVAAVMADDIEELRSIVSVAGITPTQEQWQAFCDAFEDEADAEAVKKQLTAIAEGTQQAEAPYPAIAIEKQDLFLFISRYRISISPVEILAPTAAPGSTLRLNTTDYTGAATAEGTLYTGIMPGVYTANIAAPGQAPEQAMPTEIEVFNTPYVFNGASPYVSVTVENCLSDNATIYVNGQAQDVKPVGGIVTLNNISLGSTIRIETLDDGARMEATVVYSVDSVTTLRFENYTPVAGTQPPDVPVDTPPTALSEEQINTLVVSYYQSYLNCINTQSMASLVNATQSHSTALQARVTSEDNKPYTFEYVSAEVDAQSVTPSDDGVRIRLNVEFAYRYTPREGGSATDGSNRQTVEIVYENGQWLVNRMEFVSDGDFNNHIHADL